ncbi:hypothetical protein CAEBREN_09800 [Caenorhabditis brenneri]|uniref:Uncharacterized protein n=1 Tax=Caenorhabditis brenneri TaxID=135651 RepID=G0N1J4_CAEBE|nr:hypothetical protein CAEBREN_09800 [Caenorhabditis brenneri]
MSEASKHDTGFHIRVPSARLRRFGNYGFLIPVSIQRRASGAPAIIHFIFIGTPTVAYLVSIGLNWFLFLTF